MTTPEGHVKQKVKEILEAHGMPYSLKTTFGFGHSGWPDFDVVFQGTYVTIEAKADAKKKGPTALQRERMREIREGGGITLVLDIYNWPQLEKLIQFTAARSQASGFITPQTVRACARELGIFYEGAVHG